MSVILILFDMMLCRLGYRY